MAKRIYKHNRNGKSYFLIATARIKHDGEWIPCVIYMCLYRNPDGMFWVRHLHDFNTNFK